MTNFDLIVSIALTGTVFGFAGFLAGCWTTTDKKALEDAKFFKNKERREYLLFLYIYYIGPEGHHDYEKIIAGYNAKTVKQRISGFTHYKKSLGNWDERTSEKFTEWQASQRKADKLINLNENDEDDENSYS
jgi:hypothetical protein